MEDDNEILDWGNEDDEHHETIRKPPFDSDQRDAGELDVEDSISLGDEDEDNQEYLSYRIECANGHPSNARDITSSQLRAPTPQNTLITAGAKQESQHFSGETTHEKPSTPRKPSSADDSPRRKQDTRDRASPQRSQPIPGRITHALPPKPVTTKVPPYLPPSHPSIVEATSMIISPRAGGRETKKSNGVSSGTSIPSTADELPHNWEYREARNGGGKYYYNKETHLSTWEKPVSSIPSDSSHAESRSRRRSSSTGRRHRTPPHSNPHQSQTTRPSRNSAHMPSGREMDDATKTAASDPNGLSYEDRHYRPGGEPSSAAAEMRATERLSEVVNNRISSQPRYDRMPLASPPSRRRARSSSPHETRASYLHEKEKEHQSSRGNSHSTRGQNAYTNDPQRDFENLQPDSGYAEHRWIRPPHPLDFPRSDRDSSRRRGRRQDNDEPIVDEHPDTRNRSSLRRRESSHEPNRDRDPRQSELREDASQNPVFLPAPRHGSTPPLARDRDQYYEPMVREYRAPPEEDPRPTALSSRKDRSLRTDHPAVPPINIVPPGSEVPFNRPRDRDLVQSSGFTHPSRRVGEREYDCNRREQQILERDELPRRPVEYPPSHYDREPSRPRPADFDRSSPDYVGQPSHRKRAPLPPQATTFLTSSTAPVYARDAPPHSSTAPVAPRSFRSADFSGPDGTVPLAPRSMIYVGEEPPPRSGPTGGADYVRDRGRNSSRQLDRVPNNYSTPLPPINTAMDVDDEGPLSTRGPPSPTSNRTIRNGPKQYQEDDMESPSGSRWPSSHPTMGGPSRPTASPVSSVVSGPENNRPTGRTSSTLAAPLPHLPSDSYNATRDLDRSRPEPSGRKEERMDRYPGPKSKSGGGPIENMRPPAQPGSGTNNIPIGNRKPLTPSVPSLTTPAAAPPHPPVNRYNPDARPPPSTLIDPARARELLPPGKESYERPADLEIVDTPRVGAANDASIHNKSRPSQHSESSERQSALLPAATASGRPRQRKSRFDKPTIQLEPRGSGREPSPISDKGTRAGRSDASDKRAATPPGNPQNQTLEQPHEHIHLPAAPDVPISLSHRLSDDKSRHRHGPMLGRDEKSRAEAELSFHNAHAELAREPEEAMAFQDRLERPQVQRRGASLLDRLSTGNPRSHDSGAQQSLRDRIIPSKRDREDMMDEGMREVSFDGEDGTESKRARRKNGRARTRGGRRGGPP